MEVDSCEQSVIIVENQLNVKHFFVWSVNEWGLKWARKWELARKGQLWTHVTLSFQFLSILPHCPQAESSFYALLSAQVIYGSPNILLERRRSNKLQFAKVDQRLLLLFLMLFLGPSSYQAKLHLRLVRETLPSNLHFSRVVVQRIYHLSGGRETVASHEMCAETCTTAIITSDGQHCSQCFVTAATLRSAFFIVRVMFLRIMFQFMAGWGNAHNLGTSLIKLSDWACRIVIGGKMQAPDKSLPYTSIHKIMRICNMASELVSEHLSPFVLPSCTTELGKGATTSDVSLHNSIQFVPSMFHGERAIKDEN